MTDYNPNHIPTKTYLLVGQKAIILNSQNQILVLQRSEKSGGGGKWSLPGGALENNENPYAAIEREIQEETNLSVTNLQPFSVRTYTSNDNDFVLIVGYTCTAQHENVSLNWEHDSYKWLPKEAAMQLDLTDDGRFFIEYLLQSSHAFPNQTPPTD